jgi:hypothetical protein
MFKVPALLLSAAVAWIIPANAQQAPQVGTPHFQTGTRMVLVPSSCVTMRGAQFRISTARVSSSSIEAGSSRSRRSL